MKPSRTACVIAATASLVAGVATPPAIASTDANAKHPTVTVHRTAPIAHYRLAEVYDEHQQFDHGSWKISYTCIPVGEPTWIAVYPYVGTPQFTAAQYGADIPCDGTRTTIDIGLTRRSSDRWAPDSKREKDAPASLTFVEDAREGPTLAHVETDVTVIYHGW